MLELKLMLKNVTLLNSLKDQKRTQTIIDMGYGRFAKTAGILEDEDDVYKL